MTTHHGTRLRRQQLHYRLLDRLDTLASVPALRWLWRLFTFVSIGCAVAANWDLRFVTWGLLALIVVALLILRETIVSLVKGWRDE